MRSPTPPRRARRASAAQRGVATLLMVLLVGAALAAAAMGASHQVRGVQEQHLSAQAHSQAQMKAWTGAEIVRQFLAALTPAQMSTLVATAQGGPAALAITGVAGIEARLLPATTATLVVAEITGTSAAGTRAQSRATLLARYAVGTCTACAPASGPAGLLFNRSLQLDGQITVLQDAGSTTAFEINVRGDLHTDANAITGVSVIRSTGTIHIDSGSNYPELHANCDIVTAGSVTAQVARARRNICMTGAAAVTDTATANGSLSSWAGYAANGTLIARVDATGPELAVCNPPGTSTNSGTAVAGTCPAPAIGGVDLSAGGAGAKEVHTPGHVRTDSGRIGLLRAGGNLAVTSSAAVDAGQVGGTVTRPAWNTTVNVSVVSPTVVSIPAVPLVTLPTTTFDAYDVESTAHWAFKIDAAGYRRVTVRGVTGVADGTYYLGDYPTVPKFDALCTALVPGTPTDQPVCAAPAAGSAPTICRGFSIWNRCITFNNGHEWRVDGISIAPGIAWFEGDLELGNGQYVNTWIATGHLETFAAHRTFSPDYAGYDGSAVGAPGGVCVHPDYPSLRPTAMCNTGTSTYSTAGSGGLGRYALMAGSRDPAPPNLYRGGNIMIDEQSDIGGSVLAGNDLWTGGQTVIRGYASALAQGAATWNSLGESTTFDLRNLPSTYTPGGGGGAASVTLRDARWR